MSKRPLCQANDNTCLNLAEIKGKKRSGEVKYGRWCDTHRRKGHDVRAIKNPLSKRYIPLNKCVMCNEEVIDRHCIIVGSEYTPEKTIGLCKGCHTKIHRLYDELKRRNYAIFTQAK